MHPHSLSLTFHTTYPHVYAFQKAERNRAVISKNDPRARVARREQKETCPAGGDDDYARARRPAVTAITFAKESGSGRRAEDDRKEGTGRWQSLTKGHYYGGQRTLSSSSSSGFASRKTLLRDNCEAAAASSSFLSAAAAIRSIQCRVSRVYIAAEAMNARFVRIVVVYGAGKKLISSCLGAVGWSSLETVRYIMTR